MSVTTRPEASGYSVRIDHIAEDTTEEVRAQILEFLQVYDFPYVTTVSDKAALRAVYTDYFTKRQSLDWLKGELAQLSSGRGAAIAMTETNRLHTWGLGHVLTRKGYDKCTTTHTFGRENRMSEVCLANLEGKELDIREVLHNTFPQEIRDLDRTDVPMVPQHVNCRHVLAPLPESRSHAASRTPH